MIGLVGCEESGVVRRAFNDRGHAFTSCDLIPARDGSSLHVQGDIVQYLHSVPDQYFGLIILHPDCTKVAVCGNRTWAGTRERVLAQNWIYSLWLLAKSKGKRVALENPASTIWPQLRSMGADVQFIQPHEHGHLEQKKTGLALYNLPRLAPTNDVHAAMMLLPKAQRERVFYASPGPNRKRDRSETYAGIAAAMADQWGVL